MYKFRIRINILKFNSFHVKVGILSKEIKLSVEESDSISVLNYFYYFIYATKSSVLTKVFSCDFSIFTSGNSSISSSNPLIFTPIIALSNTPILNFHVLLQNLRYIKF